jgi:hypothetical protein
MRMKGRLLRAYVKWLVRDKKLDAVLQRVPPETAELIRDPPLPGTWIDRELVAPIVAAVDEIGGKAAVRRMFKTVMTEEHLPLARPGLTGLLRIFGASPATLYKRFHQLMRTSMEGMECEYTPTSERSGLFELRYAVDDEVPMSSFIAFMPTLEAALDLCAVRGTVSEPERKGPARVVYRIIW